jgi:hypothetical protein
VSGDCWFYPKVNGFSTSFSIWIDPLEIIQKGNFCFDRFHRLRLPEHIRDIPRKISQPEFPTAVHISEPRASASFSKQQFQFPETIICR